MAATLHRGVAARDSADAETPRAGRSTGLEGDHKANARRDRGRRRCEGREEGDAVRFAHQAVAAVDRHYNITRHPRPVHRAENSWEDLAAPVDANSAVGRQRSHLAVNNEPSDFPASQKKRGVCRSLGMKCRSGVEVSKRGVEAAVCLAFRSRQRRRSCRSEAAERVEVAVQAASKRANFDTRVRTHRLGARDQTARRKPHPGGAAMGGASPSTPTARVVSERHILRNCTHPMAPMTTADTAVTPASISARQSAPLAWAADDAEQRRRGARPACGLVQSMWLRERTRRG